MSDDVLVGLREMPKRLPCRLLYDEVGAALFEQITRTEDYYPTRAELSLLHAYLPAIAAEVGVSARVIEPGSGAGIKTRLLLRALDRPASYIGIDVAPLAAAERALRAAHPELELHMILGDFTRPITLPAPSRSIGKTLVFFPGSTIGNFEPREAIGFLGRMRQLAGANALLLLGADSTRDRDVLVRAYDDREGLTAAFNKNVLTHLARARGADVDVDAFEHRAVWNAAHSRVEMHLISRVAQHVYLSGETFAFSAGEPIITEHCYKYSFEVMNGILAEAGWSVRTVYTAHEQPMRLWLCEPLRMS